MCSSHVKTAELSDLEAIVELNHGLFQEDAGTYDPSMNLNWAREKGTEYFSRHIAADASFVVVAELDDTIVGYLVGHVAGASSLRPMRMAILESMFVMRDHRCQGAGETLVEAFLTWCGQQQAQHVSVTAFARNQRAIRFYERMGFAPKNLSLERPV